MDEDVFENDFIDLQIEESDHTKESEKS